MDKTTFKTKLTGALHEPSPPSGLVENTVARFKTMENGLAAKRRLAAEGTKLTPAERTALAAEGVLGQLAGNGTLPLGADTEALKKQLTKNERFITLTRGDPAKVAAGLDSGTLLSSITHTDTPPEKPMQHRKREPTL